MELDEKAIDAVKRWVTIPPQIPTRRFFIASSKSPPLLKPAGPVGAGCLRLLERGPAVDPELRQYVAPRSGGMFRSGVRRGQLQYWFDSEPLDIQVAANVPGSLRDSVLKAIQSWRFPRPATRNGSDDPGTARVLLECRPAQTLAAPTQIYSGGVVDHPELFFRLEPEYSEEARKSRLRGPDCPPVLSSRRMVKCRAYESCGLSEWDSTSKRLAL